jgi:hypothetical protein
VLMVEFYSRITPTSTTSTTTPNNNDTWRLALLLPACLLLLTSLVVYTLGTDTPRGDVAALKKKGVRAPSPRASLAEAVGDPMVWILALQVRAWGG